LPTTSTNQAASRSEKRIRRRRHRRLGAIHFGFHDVIVHQRIAHRYVARSTCMKRIVQAHRLHHAVETKRGTVSFGFLWAPPAEALKAELARRGREGVRAPAHLR
jgi:beta-carotene 3-hydroxylase